MRHQNSRYTRRKCCKNLIFIFKSWHSNDVCMPNAFFRLLFLFFFWFIIPFEIGLAFVTEYIIVNRVLWNLIPIFLSVFFFFVPMSLVFYMRRFRNIYSVARNWVGKANVHRGIYCHWYCRQMDMIQIISIYHRN